MSRWVYFILASFFLIVRAEILVDLQKKFHGKNLVFQVEKSLSSEFLEKPQISEGKIYLTSGKLRWETTTPEKSLILFDGKTLWTQQSPNADFPGPDQVTKSKISKKNASMLLFEKLLFQGNLKSSFAVTDEKKDADQTQLTLKPKADSLNLKSLKVVIQAKELLLREVSYIDEIGNKTQIKIQQTQVVPSFSKDLFIFKIPAKAQVQEL